MEKLSKDEINAIAFIIKQELDKKIGTLNDTLSKEFDKSEECIALQNTCKIIKDLEELKSNITDRLKSLYYKLKEDYNYDGYNAEYDAIYTSICPRVNPAHLEDIKKLATYASIINPDIQFIRDYVRTNYQIVVKNKKDERTTNL